MNLKIVTIVLCISISFGQGKPYLEELPNNIYTDIPEGLQQQSLNNDKQENEDKYLEAWLLLGKGERERALSIVKKYSESKVQREREDWAILLGAIYSGQKRYEDALKAISTIRPKFEKAWTIVKNEKIKLKENELKSLKFHYYRMLLISGLANYELGNFESALKDLLEYSEEFQETFIYEYIGIAYYNNKQYSESIEYLKRSYKLHKEGELKDNAAFSISALYALLGNVEEAISWLKIPLGHNRKIWLNKLKEDEDKDFEAIRNNKQFEDFLKQQEKETESIVNAIKK